LVHAGGAGEEGGDRNNGEEEELPVDGASHRRSRQTRFPVLGIFYSWILLGVIGVVWTRRVQNGGRMGSGRTLASSRLRTNAAFYLKK
jgi:hypothetical protein